MGQATVQKQYWYIYNPQQANCYIENGVYPIKVDTHKTTKKVFFVFKRDVDTDLAFQKWMQLHPKESQ